MEAKQSIIGVYDNHLDAVRAVKALKAASFPLEHVSVIGKGEDIKEVEDAHVWEDSIISGGKIGGIFGGIIGVLAGISMISIPGVGVVFLGGTLGATLAGATTGTVTGALGGSILGTIFGLSDGIKGTIEGEEASTEEQQANKQKYRQYLDEGKFIVLVHGPEEEVKKGHDILVENEHHYHLEINHLIDG